MEKKPTKGLLEPFHVNGVDKRPEYAIQKDILDYLHKKRIVVWRISETINIIGFPDLLAIDPTDGKFVGIEVKTATGRVSSVQNAVHSIVRRSKGVVIVARSVEDVKRYFDDKS